MTTIKDIANRLGISVSAVSKGLNGAPDISEELRTIVLETAVEMGYSTKRSRKEEHRRLAVFIEIWTMKARVISVMISFSDSSRVPSSRSGQWM